jgi:hypothetical protein
MGFVRQILDNWAGESDQHTPFVIHNSYLQAIIAQNVLLRIYDLAGGQSRIIDLLPPTQEIYELRTHLDEDAEFVALSLPLGFFLGAWQEKLATGDLVRGAIGDYKFTFTDRDTQRNYNARIQAVQRRIGAYDIDTFNLFRMTMYSKLRARLTKWNVDQRWQSNNDHTILNLRAIDILAVLAPPLPPPPPA